MRTFRNALFSAIVLCLASAVPVPVSFGAYLESDGEVPVRPPERRRPVRIIPPTPEPENPLLSVVRRVDVGIPTSYRRMSIYPLLARFRPGSSGIRTLDEAFRSGWITIRERSRAEVSTLRVRNDSRHYVFLMAGEIIAGGKQNRIVKSDVLLGPRSGFVTVPVYCGERDRWTATEGKFESEKGLADGALRRKAAKAEPQGEIWKEIDARMSETRVNSQTRDYRQIYSDRKIDREVAGCVSHYRRFCGSRTVGAVVVVDHRIVSCDLFSDPDLASALWDKLSRSYSLDLLRHPHYEDERRRRPSPGKREIRAFLDRVLRARFRDEKTPGEGWSMRISGAVEGAVLNWRSEVVHSAIFPVTYYVPERIKGGEREPAPYFEDRSPKHEDGKIWR